MRYAVVTPVRNEADNLPRLAAALAIQTQPPAGWLIVDNGSDDGTRELARELAAGHEWIQTLFVDGGASTSRGAPVVRSFHAGLEALGADVPDIVVSVDADVSFEPDFFERLLQAFAQDPQLGIASGSGWEVRRGRWRQRHLTGSTVWGATRAYRRECLEVVLPLEERVGWDGIDELKANAAGWSTRIILDVPFLHHRREGERDGAWRMRTEQGRTAHYMGYRAWYLILRALYNMRADVASLGLVWGYACAAFTASPQIASAPARAYLRAQQHPGKLRARAREALGRRP
jgi:glycosyltransferase involved in cell wall biosynthesis